MAPAWSRPGASDLTRLGSLPEIQPLDRQASCELAVSRTADKTGVQAGPDFIDSSGSGGGARPRGL